jgi:hypothetical protein
MNAQFKKQQCNVVGLALGWIGYAVGMGYFTFQCQSPSRSGRREFLFLF